MGELYLFWGILMCMLLTSSFVEAAQEGALVTYLPGFNGTFPSRQYSGYVSIEHGTNLFYYFVVSERDPSKDPVVLWLNGGPGCSSFDGFIYEHGPFNFQAGKTKGSQPTLHLNPYSWSKVSNIIYLDSPAGVGFSYSENASAYTTGDIKTAINTHSFLIKWFGLYPEFVKNPFYIAGESYAGIYVPTLAYDIARGIQAGTKPKINLKGYMVGNGVTDTKFDGNALVPFAHGMGLLSDDIYKEAQDACKGNYYEPGAYCLKTLVKVHKVETFLWFIPSHIPPNTCSTVLLKPHFRWNNLDGMMNRLALEDLNVYDILEPCYHHPAAKRDAKGNTSLPNSFHRLGETKRHLPVRKRMFGRAWPLWLPVKDGIVPLWPQLAELGGVRCTDDEVAKAWLNGESIRTAIHAEAEDVAGTWEICTSRLSYYHDAGSMIPYHKALTTKGYRALVYSGDHDMCVPYTGSQAWTRSLGYTITEEWRPWRSKDQVAGYLQVYANNLTFLTVKGAGHTVPEYKPQESLDFYSRWLEGQSI